LIAAISIRGQHPLAAAGHPVVPGDRFSRAGSSITASPVDVSRQQQLFRQGIDDTVRGDDREPGTA
jgi:hypothetical protein